MHSPVGSGTLIRKKDWLKDLCTFSVIYFIGKQTLTISKARNYAHFFFLYLVFFRKLIFFSKNTPKTKPNPKSSGKIKKKSICLDLGVCYAFYSYKYLVAFWYFKSFFKNYLWDLWDIFGFPLALPFLQWKKTGEWDGAELCNYRKDLL